MWVICSTPILIYNSVFCSFLRQTIGNIFHQMSPQPIGLHSRHDQLINSLADEATAANGSHYLEVNLTDGILRGKVEEVYRVSRISD